MVSTDPAHSTAAMFSVASSPEEREIDAGLRLLEIDAEREVDRYLSQVRTTLAGRVKPHLRREVERQLHLARCSPGAAEAALFDRLADIVAGADFGDMAREHSQGPSGPSGGDLGVFGRGQMVAEFEAVAFDLAVGEVSEVFETAFGFHIVQVTDRIEAVTIGFDEAEPRIVEFLLERGRNEAAGRYVAELRADAQVETFGAED